MNSGETALTPECVQGVHTRGQQEWTLQCAAPTWLGSTQTSQERKGSSGWKAQGLHKLPLLPKNISIKLCTDPETQVGRDGC